MLFAGECFNNGRVSREKLESSEEVDQQLVMCDVINSLTVINNHIYKQRRTLQLFTNTHHTPSCFAFVSILHWLPGLTTGTIISSTPGQVYK